MLSKRILAALSEGDPIKGERFENQIISELSAQHLDFENVTFFRCRFKSCDFSRAGFVRCSFLECDLSNCVFGDTWWKEARFAAARRMTAIFPEAVLRTRSFLKAPSVMEIFPNLCGKRS